jgi:hypothetical protein
MAVAGEHDAVQDVLAVMAGTRNPRVGQDIATHARAATALSAAAAVLRTASEHPLGVDDESDAPE